MEFRATSGPKKACYQRGAARMIEEARSAQEKALKINLDAVRFGTFAEIGAGQEVAR